MRKFSALFTVAIVSTKNRMNHLKYPTKLNSLSHIIVKKYTNENAARSRPTFRVVMDRERVDFCRFSVALVDLSEPDP